MSLKMKDVRAALEPEEPDYDKAAKMGSEALPHLEKLVSGDNCELAAKAASLAGIIAAEGSLAVLKIAAQSHNPVVRVAAAGAARDLSDSDASQVLETLVGDTDVGVQKTALKSVPANPSSHLRTRLADVSGSADLPASIADSVRAIVARIERGDEMGQAEAFAEMPDIQEEMPGFDAAASVDEFGGHEIVEEREMPDFDTRGKDDMEISGETPDCDAPSDIFNEQQMPGFDESGSSTSTDVSEAETLGEMPS